jgi:hypothetical protein
MRSRALAVPPGTEATQRPTKRRERISRQERGGGEGGERKEGLDVALRAWPDAALPILRLVMSI